MLAAAGPRPRRATGCARAPARPRGPSPRSRRRPSPGGRSRAPRSPAAAGPGWPGRRWPGSSFLRARSPVTPKMTSAHGSGMRGSRRSSGSRSGLALQFGRARVGLAGHGPAPRVPRAAARSCAAPGRAVGQVQPQQRPAPAGQRQPVTGRLGRLQLAEAVRPAGHREVVGDRAGDLQERADLRPALVVLAGRVQEPRPPAERDRPPGPRPAPAGPRPRRRRRTGPGRPSRRGTRSASSRPPAEPGASASGPAVVARRRHVVARAPRPRRR